MPKHRNPRLFWLHFEGAGTDSNALPAQVLAKSLQQVQRIVHLLAKIHQGGPLGQGVQIPNEVRSRFGLMCKPPQEGSFDLPVEVSDLSNQASELEDYGDQEAVYYSFQDVTRAIGKGNGEAFRQLVPDVSFQAALIKAYKSAQPSKRIGVVLSIRDGSQKTILDGRTFQSAYNQLYSRGNPNAVPRSSEYMIGLLTGMNFGRRRMQIKPSRDCSLNVEYDERFEPMLCSLRNKLVRVRGRICYDEKGQPIRLTDIDEVQDGSVLEYNEIALRNIPYKAEPPLSFDVKFDHEHQLYELQGEFNILISGKSFSELRDSLDAELDMLWVEYAKEDPQALSLDAQELQKQLVDRFRDLR